jgi:hypothetical protein
MLYILNVTTCHEIYRPQVGPQEVAAQVLQPPPEEVLPIFPPKVDISFFVLLELQAGQATFDFSSLEVKSVSKTFLHLPHSNS